MRKSKVCKRGERSVIDNRINNLSLKDYSPIAKHLSIGDILQDTVNREAIAYLHAHARLYGGENIIPKYEKVKMKWTVASAFAFGRGIIRMFIM